MTAPNNVTFDAAKRDRLRKAYEAAKAAGVDSFEFEGNKYLVAYARYLLEFLATKLGPEGKR